MCVCRLAVAAPSFTYACLLASLNVLGTGQAVQVEEDELQRDVGPQQALLQSLGQDQPCTLL